MSNIFPELMKFNETSYQEILANLLDGKENLELKTHIVRPKKLSTLVAIGFYLKDKGLDNSGSFLVKWIKKYLTFMVSYKRLSRTEVIKALSSAVEQQQEVEGSKKLITNFK